MRLLTLAHRRGRRGIDKQDVVFVIQFKAAPVHVGGSDQREFAIHGQGLGMQQTVRGLIDPDPGREQIGVIAATGSSHDPWVIAGREHV